MKHILAAVERDALKQIVVEAAGELAEMMHAAITVCHVMSEEDYQVLCDHLNQETIGAPFLLTNAEQRAAKIAEDAAKILHEQGIDHDIVGRVGHPTEQVLSLAEELEADLIVMGFEGLHGLEKLRALGSVSRGVLEAATCPVLVMPVAKHLAPQQVEAYVAVNAYATSKEE